MTKLIPLSQIIQVLIVNFYFFYNRMRNLGFMIKFSILRGHSQISQVVIINFYFLYNGMRNLGFRIKFWILQGHSLSLRKFLGLAILGFSLKVGWVMHCGDVVLNCEVDDGKMWFWEIDEVLAKGVNLVLEAIPIWPAERYILVLVNTSVLFQVYRYFLYL